MSAKIYFLILIFFLPFDHPVCFGEDYSLCLSTMEVIDKDRDGKKDGIEIFYILKKREEDIALSAEDVTRLEGYLYNDNEEGTLISFWRLDSTDGAFYDSMIYLPFREGFAYNIYADKIITAVLKLKIVFSDGNEIEGQLMEKLSFLLY